jgi:argininosuccinate lyase
MNRFSEPPDPDFDAINRSLDVDKRLWPFDVAQSRAHVAMLAAQGIIGAEDAGVIADALSAVEGELEAGIFPFEQSDEDIHMAIERRVSEIAGEAGERIHTARSRNDQVATDLILFTREAAASSIAAIERLIAALIEAAESHIDWALPGYTHLQRAQPVYLSHHLLAYVWMLSRDRQRFQFVASQCSLLPLGSGALAGVNFDTDRARVADELGFAPSMPIEVGIPDFVDWYRAYRGSTA